MSQSKMKPSPSRAVFIEAYLVHSNATRAAIEAGYSPKTARFQGSRLLTKVDIAEPVRLVQEERAERTRVQADDVLSRLWSIATANAGDIVAFGPDGVRVVSLDHPSWAGVQRFEMKEGPNGPYVARLVMADKLAALRIVSEHLGLIPRARGRKPKAVKTVLQMVRPGL